MISSDEKAFILFTVAATSSANTAADKFINQSKAKVELRKDIKVNGLKVVKINSLIKDQSGSLQIVSYFIEKSGSVFVFHGFTKNTLFSGYQSDFIATMDGFKTLKDKTKLNVQPDRLRIRKTTKKGTLKQILTGFGMNEKDLQELALINGMDLSDQIKVNTQLKIIEKGR
jgi:predicted Zn-dependent protease